MERSLRCSTIEDEEIGILVSIISEKISNRRSSIIEIFESISAILYAKTYTMARSLRTTRIVAILGMPSYETTRQEMDLTRS